MPDDSLKKAIQSERREIEKRTAIGPLVVYEAIRIEGENELARHSLALMWSGLAAGLSMGFSSLGRGLIAAALPDAIWIPLLTSFGYTFGFMIVVLGRQQLFTENTLTAILPLFRCRQKVGACLMNVLRLWFIVLAANLVGIFLFSLTIYSTDLMDVGVKSSMLQTGMESIASGFWPTVLKGIFAGWLIALMVWLLPAAESARVWIVILITFLVGLGGFSHIIADSTDVMYAALNGSATWIDYLWKFFFPSLIGNILGGVILVSGLNHAQTMSGRT